MSKSGGSQAGVDPRYESKIPTGQGADHVYRGKGDTGQAVGAARLGWAQGAKASHQQGKGQIMSTGGKLTCIKQWRRPGWVGRKVRDHHAHLCILVWERC